MSRPAVPTCLRFLMLGVLAALAPLSGCRGQVGGHGAPAAVLAPCSVPGVARTGQCGTFAVPESRRGPARTISLRLVVLPARGAAPGRDAVFFLTGGPGTAASASAGFLARELAALENTHDFVFVDQRGTGASHPLECPGDDDDRLTPMFQAALAARCRRLLEPAADLTAYTSADAVADLEAIRVALGYERISLHGSSYGTRVAWGYAAAFPARVRTIVLHGPVPPGFHIPLAFAKGLDVALTGAIEDCLADAACATRFPRLAEDVAAAFGRIVAQPARVELTAGTVSEFTHGELAEAVRYMLYSPRDARRVPLLLSLAASGDYTPIARASLDHRRGLQRLNMGMYLSVTCSEDIPFIDEGAIAASARGSRLGDYRVRQQVAACAEWPRGPALPPRAEPLAVPALLLVGAYDPATPLESAQSGAALLSNARLVVIPHGGHTFTDLGIDDCLRRVTATFIRDSSPAAIDDTCVAQAKRPPFLLQ